MTLTPSDYISIVNVIVVFLTLIVLVWNLVLIRKQLSDQHEWYRRSDSIRYSNLFHPKVKESRLVLEANFDLFTRSDALPDAHIKKIKDDRELRLDMNYLLTYYENTAIACMNGVVDEQILKGMIKGLIIRFKKILSNYIETRKPEKNNPKRWVNLTSLANKWESEDNVTEVRPNLG